MKTIEAWPAGIEPRPLSAAQVQAWAELRAAAEKVDQEGENWDAEDLLEELSDPMLNAEEDTISLWSGGSMVAYGAVRWRVHVVDVHRLRGEGTVHPDWRGRGLGAALLPWLVRRAGELHLQHHPEADGELGHFAMSTNTGAQNLLTSHGFEECRYFFSMHRTFDRPILDVAIPPGLRMISYDPSYDAALRFAHIEAFQDHWGASPIDEERWKLWFTGSRAFRGGLSRLVLDGDEIVSYVLAYEYEADTEATGVREVYIGQVGTLRSHRMRGLARAALTAVMTAAQQSGFDRAGLGVDTDNSTGALGLYEGLGYTQAKKFIAYRRPLT